MSVTRLLFCVTLLSVICFSVGSTVDTNCGNSCDAIAPDAAQQEQFEDLVLPAAPSFIEESSHSDSDSEMDSEGELVGEFEGGVELEGENTAEIDAQQTIAAMNAAAAKIQAGVGIDSEQEQEMADSVEAEAEADSEAETELDTEESNGATMHSMRFSTGLRKPKGKTTPIRKAAKGKAKKAAKGKAKAQKPAKKAKATKKQARSLNLKKKQPKRAAGGGRVTSDRDGEAPWPKPVVRIQRDGEMPIDVGKLTPRVVVVDGQKVKLPPPVVIHQLKGQRSSGKKAEVDPEDPCFDVCHFEGGWSTRRCQQCLFRGMVNGWILHAINDGVVGYNYAHWARNQCVAVKSTNPFHPVTFSDCFFNTIHNACNQ